MRPAAVAAAQVTVPMTKVYTYFASWLFSMSIVNQAPQLQVGSREQVHDGGHRVGESRVEEPGELHLGVVAGRVPDLQEHAERRGDQEIGNMNTLPEGMVCAYRVIAAPD